jgi:hypothetical protein
VANAMADAIAIMRCSCALRASRQAMSWRMTLSWLMCENLSWRVALTCAGDQAWIESHAPGLSLVSESGYAAGAAKAQR